MTGKFFEPFHVIASKKTKKKPQLSGWGFKNPFLLFPTPEILDKHATRAPLEFEPINSGFKFAERKLKNFVTINITYENLLGQQAAKNRPRGVNHCSSY